MFVCESPSAWADRGESSEPVQCFVATKRDKRFQDVREEFGFADCYITNSVKCGPRRDKVHTEQEITSCRGFLIREIRLINPLVVVGVGGAATYALDRLVPQMEKPPALFSITHYSRRGSLEDLGSVWARQFAELLALLRQLGAAEGGPGAVKVP
jgi:uracil-DNA glycosylase family 4